MYDRTYYSQQEANMKNIRGVAPAKKRFFNSRQIRGYRSQVVAALNLNKDGAHVEIDYSTATALLEILDQTIHTEEGHEN